MSKFKVGDRVRVKGYDEVQYHIGISRERWAEQFLKPCEVVDFEQGDYRVKTHTGTHLWVHPDNLIPLDNFPLVKRPAKIGEWVYIVDDGFWPNHDLLHKLAKCVGLSGGDSTLRFDDGDRLYASPRRYLVLDGYQPEPKPMTIEEISKALGYAVKVVQEDEDGR